MRTAIAEARWLGSYSSRSQATSSSSLNLLCGNQISSFLLQIQTLYIYSKHIKLDYRFVRKLGTFIELWLQYVPINLQLADYLRIVVLIVFAFIFFCSELGVWNFQMLDLRGTTVAKNFSLSPSQKISHS